MIKCGLLQRMYLVYVFSQLFSKIATLLHDRFSVSSAPSCGSHDPMIKLGKKLTSFHIIPRENYFDLIHPFQMWKKLMKCFHIKLMKLFLVYLYILITGQTG